MRRQFDDNYYTAQENDEQFVEKVKSGRIAADEEGEEVCGAVLNNANVFVNNNLFRVILMIITTRRTAMGTTLLTTKKATTDTMRARIVAMRRMLSRQLMEVFWTACINWIMKILLAECLAALSTKQ